MIRNRILLRSVAVFFLLEIVLNTFSPIVTWALTAGPTAPEATSFEPVDTTDMVNLSSGDLAYNIPLLEVPGPNGGYPLSLSYHAGIMPDEEASWVGLGWTLNPGAIVRNVNGYADDQKDQPNFSRFFWNGGATESYTVGVSVGLAGTCASVSGNLTYSQDTYQGSGVGYGVGVGLSLSKETASTQFGANASVGVSPYGDPYASAGLSASVPLAKNKEDAFGLGANIGISTNFKTVNASASVGVSVSYGDKHEATGQRRSTSLLGASMSTTGKGVNMSGGGMSFAANSSSQQLSTRTRGTDVTIPILPILSISLGYSYNRYWIDELDAFKVNGSLYYPDNHEEFSTTFFNKNAYDTYSLLDPTLEGGIVDNSNPDKVLGGSFPGFDNYSVHAQGIYGNMRPYYFQKHLFKRNAFRKDSDGDKVYRTKQYDLTKLNPEQGNYRAEFRFINDFSNRFEHTPDSIRFGQPPVPEEIPMRHSFGSATGNVKNGETGAGNYASNNVQGSNNIIWLTNKEIRDSAERAIQSGFIETNSSGFVRDVVGLEDNIGGFVITNETGVRYHFALPAYSYAEYSQQRKRTGTTTYNDFHKPGRYAYTWYLTAITGPDFVDRGPHGAPDGILNDYDYGHWVEFDYGKWSDHYAWRNPGQGMTPDIDNRFRNFSEGKKELYFLDAIRTKSHTALFVKDIRYDAKSSVYFFHNLTETRELDGDVKRRQTPTEDSREGGFVPKVGRCKCEKQADGIFGEMDDQDLGYLDYTAVPVSSLKLSSILLVANKDLATVSLSKMHGLPYAQSDNFTWDISENRSQFGQCDFSSFVIKYHEYQNVLDIHDLANAGDLASKVLRRIDFDTDYSLSPETENSFDHSLITSTSKSTNPEDYPRHGKLTLNAVNYRGKGGAIGLPPTKFKYDYAERWHGGKLSKRDATFLLEEHDVELDVGALIKFNSASKTYYALVESVDGTAKVIRFLGKNMQPAIGNILYAATKNPPYNNLAHDVWGLYKSDFRDLGFNEKIEQIVTETSAKSLDVWSLRSVKSTTGAEIKLDFESDTYGKPVLSLYNDIAVTNMEKVGSSSILKLSTSFPNLDRILKPGTTIAYVFGFADPYSEFDLDNWAWIYGIEPEIGTGEIVVQSIYRDSNGQWIVSTNSDLQKFYDKRSDSGAKSFHAPIFVVGNLNSTAQVQNYGGGVRVKSITVESFNHSTTTQYDYRIPTSGPDHFTSGVTAYEPGAIDQMIYMYPSSGETKKFFDNTSKRTKFEKAFCREYYKGFEQLLVNSREVIAPGVLYQFVTTSATSTIEGQTTPSENYSVSEFQMFSKDLIDIQYAHDHERTFSQREYAGTNYSKKERRTVTVKDHSAQVGSLKRMTLYSRNGEKLSETRNIFLHDGVPVSAYEAALDSKFNNQGVIEETYTDARFASRPDDDFTLQGVVTKRERYPAVQLGQVTKNFKTGITSKDSTIAFDFYSGKAIATISKDGYGNVYKSVTTPAFRVYPAMRQRSEGGLNMLAQEAGTATFKVNPNDYSEHIGVVGASVQTWSNALPAVMPAKPLLQDITIQPGIWRMHASYSFIGDDNIELQNDGLFPVANYSSFGSWNGSGTTPGWQKNNAITLYDVNSHALEVIDLNQKYAATQMSLDQGKVSATIVNARYNEFAVSSAEERTADLIGSFVAAGDGDLSGAHSHTGRYSLKVFGSDHGFDSEVWITQKQKQYLMNVWVHESNVLNLVMDYHFLSESAPPVSSISFTADSKRKAGEWYLWEAVIITPEAVLEDPVDFRLVVSIRNSGSSPVFLDDFRLFPRDAAVISYVYNTWGELSHILDSNNKFTRFEYDQFGRLVTTSSESFEFDVKKVSSQIYHYGEQN